MTHETQKTQTDYRTEVEAQLAEHVLVRALCRSRTDPDSARDAIATAVADGQLVEEGERYRVKT
ncbi:hypothetical protein [Halomarina oriensis]|uniref:Uncharacterized protein n=1 Tax=Halomarina oriensis TaxID=671145 RepID=A0A6B0GJ48_9EURY|nr:hypothetical protein [Halomarina oriensis]MWG34804.1 hypothetical protein [Halomarina oriensis]